MSVLLALNSGRSSGSKSHWTSPLCHHDLCARVVLCSSPGAQECFCHCWDLLVCLPLPPDHGFPDSQHRERNPAVAQSTLAPEVSPSLRSPLGSAWGQAHSKGWRRIGFLSVRGGAEGGQDSGEVEQGGRGRAGQTGCRQLRGAFPAALFCLLYPTLRTQIQGTTGPWAAFSVWS